MGPPFTPSLQFHLHERARGGRAITSLQVSKQRKGLAAVCALVFAVPLVRTAWVCDDAYLIFRPVYNLLHGFGLRFNIAERVQAFTSPLWALLLVPAHWLFGEAYSSTQILSILLSLATVYLACLTARSGATAILALALLVSSKAFLDFSTAGLEGALLHLLLVSFFCLLPLDGADRYTLPLLVSLVASLVVTTRMDAGLLLLPSLAVFYVGQFSKHRLRALVPAVLGWMPFLLWSAFSLVYYGFFFPNTAYAKLGTGISSGELLHHGVCYFKDSLQTDRVTLVAIALGIVGSFFSRERYRTAGATGIALYLVYVLRIGGDFMSGRFFSAPFVVAVLLISRLRLPTVVAVSGSVAAVVVALLAPHPSLTSGANYGDWPEGKVNRDGISDERAVYYRRSGLLRIGLSSSHPPVVPKPLPPITVVYEGAIGMTPYGIGPAFHYVDSCALVDPLLARLPAQSRPRIGHFMRKVPAGYLETLRSGRNVIEDPALAAYYDKLAKVVRGNLFDRERLALIWGFLRGRYVPPPRAAAAP